MINELVEKNLGLVHKVINDRGYVFAINPNWAIDEDDLFQIGCMGLFQAAKNFDPDKGIKFSTYAYRIIHGTLFNYLKKQGRSKRKINSETLSLNFETVRELSGDGSTSWLELIPLNYNLEKEVENRLVVESLLEKDERGIVPYLYAGFTMTEIGCMHGVTQPAVGWWVRKLRSAAIEMGVGHV